MDQLENPVGRKEDFMPKVERESAAPPKPRPMPKYLQDAFTKFPNVRSDRNIMSGAPCVANRRIPVWCIAGRFAAGETVPSIADDYGLTQKDVRDAIRFTCWTSKLSDIQFWKFAREVGNAG
jgi:uncharacterized protein (DUF433 family)